MLMLGFSGHDCIIYDLNTQTELLRANIKGGSQPLSFNDKVLAWSHTDQLFI